MLLTVLSRQEKHTAEPLVPEVGIAIQKLKRYINRQVLTKFWQNWFKYGVKHKVPKSTKSLILFGMRKNFYRRGRKLLLYLFIKEW